MYSWEAVVVAVWGGGAARCGIGVICLTLGFFFCFSLCYQRRSTHCRGYFTQSWLLHSVVDFLQNNASKHSLPLETSSPCSVPCIAIDHIVNSSSNLKPTFTIDIIICKDLQTCLNMKRLQTIALESPDVGWVHRIHPVCVTGNYRNLSNHSWMKTSPCPSGRGASLTMLHCAGRCGMVKLWSELLRCPCLINTRCFTLLVSHWQTACLCDLHVMSFEC